MKRVDEDIESLIKTVRWLTLYVSRHETQRVYDSTYPKIDFIKYLRGLDEEILGDLLPAKRNKI